MTHENPTPVAVCIIPVRAGMETALLCIVRNNEPAKGQMAFPGGYVEKCENAQEAAARELAEETGFITEPGNWTVVDTKTNASNRMLVFCQYFRALSFGEYEDLVKLATLDPAEVQGFELLYERMLTEPASAPEPSKVLGFPLHQQAAKEFFHRQRAQKTRATDVAREILERMLDRGDIDEQTLDEMLSEVAMYIYTRA